MPLEKEVTAVAANCITAGGFVITLASIDTIISISVGILALVAGTYSIIWHRIRIKKARAKSSES